MQRLIASHATPALPMGGFPNQTVTLTYRQWIALFEEWLEIHGGDQQPLEDADRLVPVSFAQFSQARARSIAGTPSLFDSHVDEIESNQTEWHWPCASNWHDLLQETSPLDTLQQALKFDD